MGLFEDGRYAEARSQGFVCGDLRSTVTDRLKVQVGETESCDSRLDDALPSANLPRLTRKS